jgi:hypothetical protein
MIKKKLEDTLTTIRETQRDQITNCYPSEDGENGKFEGWDIDCNRKLLNSELTRNTFKE